MKKIILFFIVVGSALVWIIFQNTNTQLQTQKNVFPVVDEVTDLEEDLQQKLLYPLTIESLRKGAYQGSDIVLEQTLAPGTNYKRYLTSYSSEGLKPYALLTVPTGTIPSSGWPVIIFNHGYIPPAQYKTTERYIAYVDSFARAGYIVFRPDYRGHGMSQGEPTGAYGSNGYTIDVLNAVSSIKRYDKADSNRIGMWGHSMGGHITLRNMVVSNDVKAGVIWAGIVASYPDLLNNWRRRITPRPTLPGGARRWREELVSQYGAPEKNPDFWNSISSNTYLTRISGPLQLHHGASDASVPVEFSQDLEKQMISAKRPVELYIYPNDDHNLSRSFSVAMQRSVVFFDTHVKNSN